MKNEPEEMTHEEFKEDTHAGYGITHLDVVDELTPKILKRVLAIFIGCGLFAMITAFLEIEYLSGIFLGIIIGSILAVFNISSLYDKIEFTKFRKVEIVESRESE